MNPTVELPEFFDESWTFQRAHLREAAVSGRLHAQWTVSTICENQIEWQLAEHKRFVEEQRRLLQNHRTIADQTHENGAATLASIAMAKITSLLAISEDVVADIGAIAKCVNSAIFMEMARDIRLPYTALRAFSALPAGFGLADAGEFVRNEVDIDEAILRNERYLRARATIQPDGKPGLVPYADIQLLFDPAHLEICNDRLIITRKTSPKGGLELFDAKRPRKLAIQPNTAGFVATFKRITHNILDGLNWANVFVAGGIVLTTLLHLEPADDGKAKIQDGDIDLYIYGLGVHGANSKLREIYDVWCRNLPTNAETLVVRNLKTVTLISRYPSRRIQIILRLYKSPASVLLNFDLDPCAIGFDGEEVWMLPRCARALETGYSIFTMDLVWGHHLQARRATQDVRVFKYADRGFGIRILPSYAKCLEECHLPAIEELPETQSPTKGAYGRKPHGQEPGLKTLKRIQYMAENTVHRLFFEHELEGTPDTQPQGIMASDGQGDGAGLEDNPELPMTQGDRRVPFISLQGLDTYKSHHDFPKRRSGIGDFELWMRHHEAWRLDAVNEAELVRDEMTVEYDPAAYNDLPTYSWDEQFDQRQFTNSIESHNGELFRCLRHAVCHRLGPEFSPETKGWLGYLTHRIRRLVFGDTLDSVFEKPVAVPLLIPQPLETYMERLIGDALSDARLNPDEYWNRIIVPVHKIGQGIHILPDLLDTSEAKGNIRYWLLGTETMWAGIDRRLDEIYEILQLLFLWVTRVACSPQLDIPEALLFLIRRFYDRLPSVLKTPKPEVEQYLEERIRHLNIEHIKPATSASRRAIDDSTFAVLPEREARLFQVWALDSPPYVAREYSRMDLMGDWEDFEYPPVEDLFWKDGDEGSQASCPEALWVSERGAQSRSDGKA